MSQAGGSATINGILYQLLGAISRAGNLRLRATCEDGDIGEATLVIEPTGGGGDLRIYFPGKKQVEQWKAKSDHGSWSLQQVITSVLPDLYLAVRESDLDDQSEYRFVTEGRRGGWSEAQEFFHGLAGSPTPEDPLSLLDCQTPIRISPQQSYTPRELFLRIVAAVRKRKATRTESKLLTYRKLWHLLARFDINPALPKEQLCAEINHFLRGVVDYREDVDAKRQHLCGLLLDLAARGEVRITPKELLQQAGLNAVAAHHWSALRENLSKELHRQLRMEGYQHDLDVRETPEWCTDQPILLLAGESGQGKSWHLFRIAVTVSAGEGLAVLVTQNAEAEQVVQAAADIVWKSGLNHNLSLTLDRVAHRIRNDLVPNAPQPWLTVCVDDVQSPAVARALLKYDWRGWGMRLTMTVPHELGRILKEQYEKHVQLVEVPDFTTDQLRTYLQRHGREWQTVPSDVRDTLKRPLLARLYCDVTQDAAWVPMTEYDLFERYWHWLREAREQYDFPGDEGKMRQLAGQVLLDEAVYPWPRSVVDRVGIDDATQRRLEMLGWLRRREDGRVEVWHDRLLNWAVAEFLVEQRQSKVIDSAALGAWLTRFHRQEERFAKTFLGYVPMDVLWLASDPARGLVEEPPLLIAALEGNNVAGGSWNSLYGYLLPTLGARVLPALDARFRAWTSEELMYREHLLPLALKRIGKRFPEPVQMYARQLLDDPLLLLRHIGMRILAEFPSATALDRLWELQQHNAQQLAATSGTDQQEAQVEALYEYDLVFSALRACTNLNPHWLVQTIHMADAHTAPVWDLAYLLADLQDSDAQGLWTAVKPLLFTKMPSEKPRSLINCIRRFRDAEEIPRLEQWMSERTDFAFGAALAALVVIDPDRALHHQGSFPPRELSLTKLWWFYELLSRRRDGLIETLLALMQSAGAEVWEIVRLYRGDSNEMDVATLELLLQMLDRELSIQNAEPSKEMSPNIRLMFEVLANVSRPELLEQMEKRAPSQLEDRVMAVACARVNRAGRFFDHDLHHARLLLLKIGGHGLTTLVNHELASSDVHAKIAGLTWTLVRPDEQTKKLLRDLTQDEQLAEINEGRYAQVLAIQALAALQEDEAVMDAVLRRGLRIPVALLQWRGGHITVSDEKVRTALQALESEDPRLWPGAILTVGFSRRHDLISNIRAVVAKAKTNSHVARATIIALREMDDATSGTVRFLQDQLSVAENQIHAVNALIRVGTTEAREILTDYFKETVQDFSVLHKIGIEIGHFLARDPQQRPWIATTLWSALQNQPSLLWRPEDLALMGDADDQRAREWLMEQAFPPRELHADTGRLAGVIRAIARFDLGTAFAAARHALEIEGNREAIPPLLVELNARHALSVLCEHMPQEHATLVRWAIGRALRRSQDISIVQDTLEQMVRDADFRVRRAGAELGGWLDGATLESTLSTLTTDDPSDTVRTAARDALRRRKDHHAVRQLFDVFRSAQTAQRWNILEAIIELGDPILLGNQEDSLWLGQMLQETDIALTTHAKRRLEEREKELRSEAEQTDHHSNNHS